MGRGKVVLKRIEDRSSRHVSFTRRRNGLMKKAQELSVLCDVDVGLFVFSGRNRLYEFSTGESMTEILGRYQDYKRADEAVRRSVREKLALESKDVWTFDELTQMILWHLDENKVQQSSTDELCQLEKQIDSIRQQVRTRKTHLLLGGVKALQEEIMAVQLNGITQN